MNPLLLANWRHINQAFTALAWIAAVALTCYVLAELQPRDVTPHRHANTIVVGR